MNLILDIILTIFLIALLWLLPAVVFCFLILKFTKKKLSKGWCITAFIICCILSFTLSALLGINWNKLGIIWQFICYVTVYNSISFILYNPDADSFFDSEKEISRKKSLKESQNK